ncbi:MAG: sulfurtransferase [bacterium]|nr:sulfurtransferase [bacterium]
MYPKINLVFFLILIVLIPYQIESVAPPIKKIVSTSWLELNLEKNIKIVDVRGDIKSYWEGHIPGAVYLHPESLRLSENGVPGKLIDPNILYDILEDLGIDDNSWVIVYSDGNDFKATYFIWALDYISHNQSSVLDGGFEKWKKEGKKITKDYPKIEEAHYNLPRNASINYRIKADLEYVKENKDKKDVILLDVRAKELYDGKSGMWKRLGHIPGAIHHFWGDDLNEDGSWKSKEELEKEYKKIGITFKKTVIVSCGQGQMSSHTYFTLKYILGIPNVLNYDGSFNEWSNIDSLPVEKME